MAKEGKVLGRSGVGGGMKKPGDVGKRGGELGKQGLGEHVQKEWEKPMGDKQPEHR